MCLADDYPSFTLVHSQGPGIGPHDLYLVKGRGPSVAKSAEQKATILLLEAEYGATHAEPYCAIIAFKLLGFRKILQN